MKCNFSLEAYAPYATCCIRPVPLPGTSTDSDIGRFTYVELAWNELEPSRGAYRQEAMKEAIAAAINPILVIRPDLPSWVKEDPAGCFAAFIRKAGSFVGKDSRLAGVVISTLADGKEEWNAYIDAFESAALLANLHHAGLIRHMRQRGREFGLIVTCSEADWIDSCEAFARQQLQYVWKRMPVVLHITDPSIGPAVTREARRWHASLANMSMGLGARLTLRRMTYPASATSGGSLPLRLWFVNTGSSRLYREVALRLRLRREGASCEIPIQAETHAWLTGDLVHNEILKLPKLTAGNYSVGLGIFFKDGSPVCLHIQDQGEDGYYEAGTLRVEGPGEDPFLHIWDTFYPEGYYPLEDPKVPETVSEGSDTSNHRDQEGI